MNIRPRVLLADDHTMLLEAFRELLAPTCNVVGTVSDGRALLEAAPRLKPDVIVVDISMPRTSGRVVAPAHHDPPGIRIDVDGMPFAQ